MDQQLLEEFIRNYNEALESIIKLKQPNDGGWMMKIATGLVILGIAGLVVMYSDLNVVKSKLNEVDKGLHKIEVCAEKFDIEIKELKLRFGIYEAGSKGKK